MYKHIGDRLDELAVALGMESARATIARSHELLCQDSAAYPRASLPLRRSTLNADGTPIQLSLTLGPSGARLQFLSDVGAPQLSNSQRLATGRARLRELAELFGTRGALESIEPLLERMAPSRVSELLANDAGAFWIGAGFSPEGESKLKIYVNAKWGQESARWARLEDFANRLGAGVTWRDIRELVADQLDPLGVALGAGSDGAVAGRIYLSGYGKAWSYLEALGGAYGGGAYQGQLRHYGKTLLGEDYAYPTRSVVCSFGLLAGQLVDVKVELCGHCAFDSDLQARERCLRWLGDDKHAATIYTQAVEVLSGSSLSSSQTTLHSYVSLGSGRDRTFYFNPAATSARR